MSLDWSGVDAWLRTTPILVLGLLALFVIGGASVLGIVLRSRQLARRAAQKLEAAQHEGYEGYIVSAVLGLLALLMGFTFSLAIDRFDSRRILVLHEANAIGTTYLRAQLLEEPHRARISALLLAYTGNRIALAGDGASAEMLADNDRLITDLWTATAAAFPAIKDLDFSSSFLETMNNLIDLDAARKAARGAHVPTEVLVVLFIYLAVTAGVLGYVLGASGRRAAAGFLLVLLTLSLVLVIDIDRPTRGGVLESQAPMSRLAETLRSQSPDVFDRWRVLHEASVQGAPSSAE
jgi:hypothetical protein